MKIAFYTLGCKVNQYETNWLKEQMEQRGFLVVDHTQEADVYVINSCTVTAESDRKTRQAVRKYKRSHPDSIVVLTGCMPQAFPDDAAALAEADIVLGNKNNRSLPDLLQAFFIKRERIVAVEPHQSGDRFSDCAISGFDGRTRAIVKIEDGCNRFCSYCVIPYSRGRVRSKPLDALDGELTQLETQGFREIVLVGINLSAYGTDIGKTVCDAVELACSKNFARVRLGSLEPDHITDEVLNRLAVLPNFCPQFHISLQSGCDQTLTAMNRHYTVLEYKALCEKIRSKFIDASITTDMMVGFPGETEEDFLSSAAFAQEIGFEKVHVFPYSPRKGTRAAELPQIQKHVKEDRAHRLIEITDEIRYNFLRAQIGRTVQVLAESRTADGCTEGYTKNYTPVRVPQILTCGELYDVKIIDAEKDCCIGEVVSSIQQK